MKTIRILVLALAALAVSGCHVKVGDSITALIHNGWIADDNMYVDAEAARGPENTGVNNNRTANEVIDLLIPFVEPGEWLIIQEDGGQETPGSYREFVDGVVLDLPDDRCLAWVTPFNMFHVERDAAFNVEIREGIAAQPCHVVVEWAEMVSQDPDLYLVDGLHPNQHGADTLDALIKEATSITTVLE